MRWAPGEPGRRNRRWRIPRPERERWDFCRNPPTHPGVGGIGAWSLAPRATQRSRNATDA